MTKIAYLDCPTGIAGDMCLGALVDAGVPLHYFQDQLATLGIKREFELREEQIEHQGQAALKVHVELLSEMREKNSLHPPSSHHHSHSPHPPHPPELPDQGSHQHAPHRHLKEIRTLIEQSEIPQAVKTNSISIFERLAQAEAAVHGCDIETVHFHEVGATDAIVDIVGTCLGLHWLGVEQVYCSALPTGGGTVWAAHGRLPVPAPAVLKLFELGHVPVYGNGIERELVTPTGAAIATVLAGERFGPCPAMKIQTVGLGAGTAELKIPNILRLWIGESSHAGHHHASSPHHSSAHHSFAHHSETNNRAEPNLAPSQQKLSSLKQQTETITVLETQLDDLSPQAIGYVFEQLLEAGALDVFTGAIAMKKNRPGTLLTVLCKPEQVQSLEAILFRETTTLGIRRREQQRTALARAVETVKTPYGPVRVKIAWSQDSREPSNVHPEYEDCAKLAREYQQPWHQIHRLALDAYFSGETPHV